MLLVLFGWLSYLSLSLRHFLYYLKVVLAPIIIVFRLASLGLMFCKNFASTFGGALWSRRLQRRNDTSIMSISIVYFDSIMNTKYSFFLDESKMSEYYSMWLMLLLIFNSNYYRLYLGYVKLSISKMIQLQRVVLWRWVTISWEWSGKKWKSWLFRHNKIIFLVEHSI